MSDGGAASSNSWTLLSQEENVATLRPLAEGTEHHGDSSGNVESQPPEGATLAKTEHSAEDQQASEEHMAGQCEVEPSPGPTSDPSPALIPASETPPPPPSLVIPAHSLHGGDAHSQSEGLPEGPVQSSPEPDSFSDSYTHISPSSPDEPPVPELLGGLELREEEVEADRPGSEEEGSERVPQPPELGSSVDPQVGDERGREDMEAEEEAKVRRRSLLASLEHIGRREEEEEEEEEEAEAEREAARFPRRDGDSGFSVNKCILGAVILLGLGTIFFSENDAQYTQRELRDTEQPVNQEWLKPEAPPQAAVDAGPKVLNMLVKETQQIAKLTAKAQAQKQELNVATGQAAEGVQEQLRRRKKEEEEVQEENVNAASSLPPVKATTTTAPPAVQERDSRPEGQAKKARQGEEVEKPKEGKKEKHDTGEQERKWEQKESRDQAKTRRKEEEPSRPEHQRQEQRSKEAKEQKPKEERREGKEQGEGRKDKGHRGDEGEPWKDRGDRREWRGKEERREEKEWKKGKYDKLESSRGSERKGHEKEAQEAKDRGHRTEWRGKEEEEERQDWKAEKDWRSGKEEKEWKKGKEGKEWKKGKEGKEWKKGKEGKEWKKGKEEKEWKKGKDEKEWKKGKEEKEWGRGEEERTDRKKEREWKKGKFEKSESHREKERRGHEEEEEGRRDGKGRREHGEWRQEKEEERKKGEGAWKKGRESGKAWKQEQREWREKGEPKEWRRDSDERRGKHDGDRGRERRWGGEEQKEDHTQGGGAKRETRKQEWKDADRTNDGNRISRREEDVADHKKPEQRHHDHQHHHHHHKESMWQGPGDGKPTHTHARRRPAFGQPDYWLHQRERLRQNALPSRHCSGVEACARAQGTLPVQLSEFQALLAGYVARAEEEAGVDASAGEELRQLAAEFFKDGVFAHDQMSFRDYVEDVADILEEMVDRDGAEEGEEEEQEDDSDLEDEMEMFGKEVMKRFAVEGSSEKEWKTGNSKKETERSRG